MRAIKWLWILAIAATLTACTSSLGRDGSFHPDATARFSNYTGQGSDGEGWIGNSDGEGGPSAEPPLSETSPDH